MRPSEVWFHDRYLGRSWNNGVGGATNESLVSAVGYFKVCVEGENFNFCCGEWLLFQVAVSLIAILYSIISQIPQNDASLPYSHIYGLKDTQRC
jgi:hypothetical protein